MSGRGREPKFLVLCRPCPTTGQDPHVAQCFAPTVGAWQKNPWDKKAEGALHLVHNIQGDPRAYVEGSSEASQTQEANVSCCSLFRNTRVPLMASALCRQPLLFNIGFDPEISTPKMILAPKFSCFSLRTSVPCAIRQTRPPAPLQVSAWNEHQAEQVAAHIEKLSQQGRPHERLDPINGRQRSPSPLSWQMAQAQRVGSPPLPASSKGAAAGLVGSAPAAASPTLKDIARNPLRPPTSRPVLPTAVWKPHRHTPMAALGPQEARPSTAPSYVTVGVGFSPSSWGFGPELRPNSAQNAHRQPSARIIRQTRRPADSSQVSCGGPVPSGRPRERGGARMGCTRCRE